MKKIFICYRRTGEAFAANQIYQTLEARFGGDLVFMDTRKIPIGVDFRRRIQATLVECDTMLVVMERNWVNAVDEETGGRRLENAEDFVRLEVEEALARGMLLIPILVGTAKPPNPELLPPSMRELAFSLGTTVRPGPEYQDDMRRLIEALENAPRELEEARELCRHFDQIWESGDWLAAHRTLVSALEHGGESGLPPYRKLVNRKPLVDELAKAAQLLERGEFENARKLLDGCPVEQSPPNLEAAKAIAAIGWRLSEPGVAASEVEALAEQLRDVVAGAAGALIPGEREARARLVLVQRETEYREALALYHGGRFSEARERFAQLADFRDARNRLALCEDWIEVLSQLRSKAWTRAKTLLRNLRARDPSPTLERWLQWTNKLSILVPVLERMAAGHWVADPRVPWEGGECPYELLGVAPTVSSEQVNELGFELQARPGGMSSADRHAWDALRRVENRLQVDFALYHVHDPSLPRRLLDNLCVASEGNDPEATLAAMGRTAGERSGDEAPSALTVIGSALGREQGVFHALLRSYDAALQFFLAEVRARPDDPWAFHHLGLVAAAKIQVHGVGEDDLADAWESLIQGWGSVFGNDGFWHEWWIERRKVYQLPSKQQIQDARNALQRFWLEEAKAVADRYPGIDVLFRAEIQGARAVCAGGGTPLAPEGRERAVVGLLGARAAGLAQAVSRWTASFGAEALQREDWPRRVCLYFSQLAEPTTLTEDGRFPDVVRALSAQKTQAGPAFVAANPGFAGFNGGLKLFERCRSELLEQAHFKVGLAAAAELPLDMARVLEPWREAVALAKRRGAAEPLLGQIRDLAIGRANFLSQSEGERRLDALNDAVRLVQDLIDEGWDREQALKDALVDALLNRAMYLSLKFDAERDARLDAQRAWVMSPESLRTIAVLSTVSLYDAKDLFHSGHRPLAEALLREVDQHLEKGERLFPDNTDLATCRSNAEVLREMLDGRGSAELAQALAKLTTAAADSTADQTRGQLSEAMIKEARQEFGDAIAIYWHLAQRNPDDRSLRGLMAQCYRSWIHHARDTSVETAELRRIIQEAHERCPGFEALSDIG